MVGKNMTENMQVRNAIWPKKVLNVTVANHLFMFQSTHTHQSTLPNPLFVVSKAQGSI